MYPKEESCKFCYCKPGFDNSTVGADNPNCYETQCGLELHAGDRIAMGCIPIYFGNHRCCPISWKCRKCAGYITSTCNISSNIIGFFSLFALAASDSDEVIVEGRIEQDDDAQPEPAMQCKFGKLTLNKGDGVSSDDKCVECKCTVPPLAHCIQREDC